MNNILIRRLLRLMPLCVGILMVIEIVIINEYAGTGSAIRTVDATIVSLRQENNILEQRVASASSYLTIAVKAKEAGFVEPTKSQYLTIASSEPPVALYNPQ